MNDLITVPESSIEKVFKKGGTTVLIQTVRKKVEGIVPDLATTKGRKAIASLAAKVAKSKTYLDSLGKTYVAELKKDAVIVDAERRSMRDQLDTLKAEVRKPLTDWEEEEAARVANHRARIQEMKDLAESCQFGWMTLCIEDLTVKYDAVKATVVDSSWEEFEVTALRTQSEAFTVIDNAITARKGYDKDQADLEAFRKTQAEAISQEEDNDQEAALATSGLSVHTSPHNTSPHTSAPAVSDYESRRSINRQVGTYLVEQHGLTEDKAKEIVSAIIRGRIPPCTISYD